MNPSNKGLFKTREYRYNDRPCMNKVKKLNVENNVNVNAYEYLYIHAQPV